MGSLKNLSLKPIILINLPSFQYSIIIIISAAAGGGGCSSVCEVAVVELVGHQHYQCNSLFVLTSVILTLDWKFGLHLGLKLINCLLL